MNELLCRILNDLNDRISSFEMTGEGRNDESWKRCKADIEDLQRQMEGQFESAGGKNA